jgi:Chitin synthase export chaperone
MGFGSFNFICEQAALPLCSLVGTSNGIEPICYARNVQLANTLIFQTATDFIHIAALIMTTVMIFHVRSKYTAVGRKEIITFFYLYMALTVVSLMLDSGVIPMSSVVFPYFVAVQCGLSTATCWCLLVNGFVGFQFAEDGTPLSLWLLRLSSLGAFLISGAVSLCTFQGWASLSPTSTTALFVVLYIFNAVFLAVYVILQVALVLNTLEDRWPLGDIAFGVFFLVVGQVLLYVFSSKICNGAKHYLDGLFFATLCNLLGVMMVYKYWDSITKEDLEFSVASKANVWLLHDEKEQIEYDKGFANGMYSFPRSESGYFA